MDHVGTIPASLAKLRVETIADVSRIFANAEYRPIRSNRHRMGEQASALIEQLFRLFFPDCPDSSGKENGRHEWYRTQLQKAADELLELLHPIVCQKAGPACRELGGCQDITVKMIQKLPDIREKLWTDVQVAFDSDPAAPSLEEIVMAYPGIYAIMIYRVAHELHTQGVALIPRMMTEQAHKETGIDIHPGARIGRGFFIDHGTGVVIGETTDIGDCVKLYQGVTLGAIHVVKNIHSTSAVKKKRHPTIEDQVTIYAGATILGGDTVIGQGSIIGGNVWLTESVLPFSKVVNTHSVECITRTPTNPIT